MLLTACKTAADESPRFGTLAALPKGFFAAGANVVVASLWSVDADATGALALAFMKHAIDGSNTARALSQARADVAADPRWQHPFFWAGLEHLGVPITVAVREASAPLGVIDALGLLDGGLTCIVSHRPS